jgi:D-alanyl-D-alanine carboxypeptidase
MHMKLIFAFLSLGCCGALAGESNLTQRISAAVEKQVSEDAFSGVALVAQNGTPVFEDAYGLADKEMNRRNTKTTKFNLGSINKSFTAVAIAQLAQEGKLAYSDTIGKHLPDYPNKEITEKITIHQLLTHTSGLGDYMNREFMARKAELKTPADILPLFVNQPLEFEPGAKTKYSNAGYIVLGLIIERLSGQSYFDYVKQRIFTPAGMNDTGSFAREKVADLAIGYTTMTPMRPQPGPRHANTQLLAGRGSPAGGDYSTAGDMLKFANALLGHKLLGAAATDGLFDHGYGFLRKDTNGLVAVTNAGGGPGINAVLRMLPERRWTVVVLSNYDPPSAERVTTAIQELLPLSN